MEKNELINWLLEGDVSIQYQVHRDLLDEERNDLSKRIEFEGWGAEYLTKRNSNGHWGLSFYQPKWTSSHYTLLELRNLRISRQNPLIHETIQLILRNDRAPDKGVHPLGSVKTSDVCINGMFLNYASYFKVEEEQLKPIVDFILSQKMPDGGFNCRSNRSGAVHSSMHTTLMTLEGITEYEKNGYTYRLEELKQAKQTSIEFLLLHKLFLSDRTGEIIKMDFLKLAHPGRWRYDILRALDYFQVEGILWDDRIQPAIDILYKKRNKDLTWNVQAKHPGKVYFEMEKSGKPSRWNTLRAMRVLKHFGIE